MGVSTSLSLTLETQKGEQRAVGARRPCRAGTSEGLVTAVTAPHSAVTSSKPNYSHVSEIHTYEDPYVSSLSREGPRRTARLAFGFVEEETESLRGQSDPSKTAHQTLCLTLAFTTHSDDEPAGLQSSRECRDKWPNLTGLTGRTSGWPRLCCTCREPPRRAAGPQMMRRLSSGPLHLHGVRPMLGRPTPPGPFSHRQSVR